MRPAQPHRIVPILLLTAIPTFAHAQQRQPMRILLTNDDGIAEVRARLLPVADRLREFAEVCIVVPDRDRSGSSNFLSINRRASLESRLEHRAEPEAGRHLLEMHSLVDGYPADCVVLGGYGLLDGAAPDPVISGPNGGANLADGWLGSGTIGAARTAAYLGVPALAISGMDSDAPDQVVALAEWVARVARSEVVRSLPPLTYLTVAIPRIAPGEIRGVRVARTAELERLIEALPGWPARRP